MKKQTPEQFAKSVIDDFLDGFDNDNQFETQVIFGKDLTSEQALACKTEFNKIGFDFISKDKPHLWTIKKI